MKKATEYAAIFDANPTIETVREITFDFLMEIKEIAKVRRAVTDAAMLAIFREQDRKWQSFADKAGGGNAIRRNGFRVLTQIEFPFMAHALGWKDETR